MKSTNQTTTLLRSILRQRIKIEKMGVSKKSSSIAIKAGDFLNHISMFETEIQTRNFVKKNINSIIEICVNPNQSKVLKTLIDLSFLNQDKEIKNKIQSHL